MKITDETIKYVSALAKLDLNDKEREDAKTDLEKIINYMERMNEIDTTEIEPTSHIFPVINVFREDQAIPRNNREQLLENAPTKKDGCFVVPKTVE